MPIDEPGRPRIPYGRQLISEEDIQAVAEVLRSDWLTTGPMVERFERAFAEYTAAAEAVAVSSGTAALHAAMFALEIGPGDEVIVPAMTFAATANCVVYQGATPVFADVDPQTLLLGPAEVQAKLTPQTKAAIAVDYAGQPCDYEALRAVADEAGIALVADAAHSLGGSDHGRPVGSLADLNTFSLHPVKPITTGEGGMITTDDPASAERMRRFRNHGFTRDHLQRSRAGSWHYEMTELGLNYRLTDIQCALGLSQLPKLDGWIARRQQIAAAYDRHFVDMPGVQPLATRPQVSHGRHLYVVRIDPDVAGIDRGTVFERMQAASVGVGVHYIPVHLHPYYRRRFATAGGDCPVAEAAYEQILSLPIFPAMTDADVARVVATLRSVCGLPAPSEPTP